MTVSRHYADVGGRRVQYRRAGTGPAVVLLHESPRSSVALLPLIERISDSFTVFAFDTPGYGQSDPLRIDRPGLGDFADALAETLAALGIARVPIYGTHTGAAIAWSFAVRHPDACAIAVLDGFPVFSATEREEYLANYLPPFLPAVDGTHLAWLWSRVRDQTVFFPWYRRGESSRLNRPVPDAAALHVIAMDILRAGDRYRSAYAPAFASRPLTDLPALRAPVLAAAREDDVLLGHLDRLPDSVPKQRFPADRDTWAACLRDIFRAHAVAPAPAPAQAALPRDRVGCAYVGGVHVRGCLGGTGRPLVLRHPVPGGSVWFAERLERLAGERPVLAPDLPGCGDSAADASLDALNEIADVPNAEIESAVASDTISVELFRLDPYGRHLFAAWHHVRDAVIFGGAPFDALDPALLHARTVDILKTAQWMT